MPPRCSARAGDFRSDVLALVGAAPPGRQLLALSATYTPDAMRDLRQLMRRPREVLLCQETTSLLGVRQLYRLLATPAPLSPPQQHHHHARGGGAGGGAGPLDQRLAALLALLSSLSFQQAVVFCNHRWEAAELAGRLAGAGYPAACLSGQRSQLERIDTLNALRELR